MNIQFKSREIPFIHNIIYFSCAIVWKCYMVHDNHTVVFCGQFQNGLTTEPDIKVKRDFTRFEFEMSFGMKFCITHAPGYQTL